MRWPGFNPEDEGYKMEKVPLTTLYRWYMYDMSLADPNNHLDIFGMTPVSEEGDEKERQESDARTDMIEPLLPFLNLYANINAQYIFEMQKKDAPKDSEMFERLQGVEAAEVKNFYRKVTFAGLVTTLSSAVELGLLGLNGTFTDVD